MNSIKIYYVVIGVMLLAVINALMWTTDLEEDLSFKSGTFRKIQSHKSYRSTSFTYTIYLNEYKDPFKISADYVTCFDFGKFDRTVDPGDSLTIAMSDNNGLFVKESVAYLHSTWHSYFDLDCRNQSVSSSKKSGLIFGIIVLLALTLVVLYKKRKLANET